MMSSNDNGAASSGGGDHSDGRDSSGDRISSKRNLKKQNQEKLPQRGKGVAALEKILRDQELGERVAGYTSLKYPQLIDSPRSGGSDILWPTLCGIDPIISPGYPFPSNGNHQFHYSPDLMLQNRPSQYPPPMMPHSQHYESLYSSNNFSAGHFQPLVQPSNQTSSQNFNYVLPQDDQMVGAKLPWTSSIPPFDNQASPPFPQQQIVGQSPGFGNHNAITLDLSQPFPRGTNDNITNYGGLNGNFGVFSFSTTSQPDISAQNSLSLNLNGILKRPHQTSGQSGSSVAKRPSYRPEGEMREEEITLSLSLNKDETTDKETDIDLDLKL